MGTIEVTPRRLEPSTRYLVCGALSALRMRLTLAPRHPPEHDDAGHSARSKREYFRRVNRDRFGSWTAHGPGCLPAYRLPLADILARIDPRGSFIAISGLPIFWSCQKLAGFYCWISASPRLRNLTPSCPRTSPFPQAIGLTYPPRRRASSDRRLLGRRSLRPRRMGRHDASGISHRRCPCA
jgi:hypothetical protein